jgi:hypothetical protein
VFSSLVLACCAGPLASHDNLQVLVSTEMTNNLISIFVYAAIVETGDTLIKMYF